MVRNKREDPCDRIIQVLGPDVLESKCSIPVTDLLFHPRFKKMLGFVQLECRNIRSSASADIKFISLVILEGVDGLPGAFVKGPMPLELDQFVPHLLPWSIYGIREFGSGKKGFFSLKCRLQIGQIGNVCASQYAEFSLKVTQKELQIRSIAEMMLHLQGRRATKGTGVGQAVIWSLSIPLPIKRGVPSPGPGTCVF